MSTGSSTGRGIDLEQFSRPSRARGSARRDFLDRARRIGEAEREVPARSLRPLPALLVSLLLAAPASAQPVVMRCERLAPEQRDELRARMRLVLRARPQSALPSGLELECTDESATLIWKSAFNERIPIDESPGLVEGTLDALEARLAQVAQPKPKPPPRRPIRRLAPAQPPAPALAGGAGIGVLLEAVPGPATVGPRLELAAPLGPISIVAMPGLRAAPHYSLLYSGEAGVAFGAPYRSDLPLGAVVTLSVEALSAVARQGGPESNRWTVAPGGSLGVRAGASLDRAMVWIGVDLHRRFEPLAIERPEIALARTSLLLSMGCLFGLDLSERKPVL